VFEKKNQSHLSNTKSNYGNKKLPESTKREVLVWWGQLPKIVRNYYDTILICVNLLNSFFGNKKDKKGNYLQINTTGISRAF
jgi:hypothetical protein